VDPFWLTKQGGFDMAMVTGGEVLVRTLEAVGVRHIFGIHGAHLETVFQGCREHDITVVDTRHEVAAGHAAEGYARSLRQLGVAMGTAGPGFTNLLTSLTNAYLDHSPVLYLSGSAALSQAETNTLQSGFDQVAMARPVTKWAHQVTVTKDIPRLVAQAIRVATSAPMGPVLLDLPMDILSSQVNDESAPIPKTITVDSASPPESAAISAAIELLLEAKRPVILVGAGAWYSHAEDELRRFVDTTGIPVYSDFQAQRFTSWRIWRRRATVPTWCWRSEYGLGYSRWAPATCLSRRLQGSFTLRRTRERSAGCVTSKSQWSLTAVKRSRHSTRKRAGDHGAT
jgi:acetolactate synthase-1/2/3 large subunit